MVGMTIKLNLKMKNAMDRIKVFKTNKPNTPSAKHRKESNIKSDEWTSLKTIGIKSKTNSAIETMGWILTQE